MNRFSHGRVFRSRCQKIDPRHSAPPCRIGGANGPRKRHAAILEISRPPTALPLPLLRGTSARPAGSSATMVTVRYSNWKGQPEPGVTPTASASARNFRHWAIVAQRSRKEAIRVALAMRSRLQNTFGQHGSARHRLLARRQAGPCPVQRRPQERDGAQFQGSSMPPSCSEWMTRS
jgi:hypothetical protein